MWTYSRQHFKGGIGPADIPGRNFQWFAVSSLHYSTQWPCAVAAAATVPAALSLTSLEASGAPLRCGAAWKLSEILLQTVIPYFYLALRLPETHTKYLLECLVWQFNDSYLRFLTTIKFEIMNLNIDISTHETQEKDRDSFLALKMQWQQEIWPGDLWCPVVCYKIPFTALAREKAGVRIYALLFGLDHSFLLFDKQDQAGISKSRTCLLVAFAQPVTT